jgi:hypothetical protein
MVGEKEEIATARTSYALYINKKLCTKIKITTFAAILKQLKRYGK